MVSPSNKYSITKYYKVIDGLYIHVLLLLVFSLTHEFVDSALVLILKINLPDHHQSPSSFQPPFYAAFLFHKLLHAMCCPWILFHFILDCLSVTILLINTSNGCLRILITYRLLRLSIFIARFDLAYVKDFQLHKFNLSRNCLNRSMLSILIILFLYLYFYCYYL